MDTSVTRLDPPSSSQLEPASIRLECFLEIEHSESGQLATFGLTGSRQLIGRTPDLPIRLDHDGVSRLHAALIRDPYDRWWIHDLGSTNGTYVNGSAVTQRLLNPGDTIQIGPYRLTLKVPGDPIPQERPKRAATARPRGHLGEMASTTRLPAITAERLNAALSLEAVGFARSLLRLEDAQLRLKQLCEHAVNDRIPGMWSCVFRLTREGTSGPVFGPMTRPGIGSNFAPSPKLLEALCRERRESFLNDAGPHILGRQHGLAGNLVACVLDLSPGGVDLFFVELSTECDPDEWTPLLALLAESYANANEFWQTRGQFSVNAAVQRELEMAQQLQDSLIPRLPAVAGLDLSIGYHPSRWVGGDYADAVRMPDGRLLIAIADVCGKGLQAALVASSLHTLVHVLVEVCHNLAELVMHMDAYLCRYLPGESFVTMVCVALDVRTGEIECLNLGHLPPLLVGAGGSVRPLQAAQNLALGMMPFTPQSERYYMERDEVLLLYTDGLTELENGRRPGEEPAPPDTGLLAGALGGCVQIIHSMQGADLNAIRDRMSQSIRIQLDLTMASDDAAFVLARLKGTPAPFELHGSTMRPPGAVAFKTPIR
ncbi:MAG: SpoIIE family protein phosphatase [Myxococcota bacterium]